MKYTYLNKRCYEIMTNIYNSVLTNTIKRMNAFITRKGYLCPPTIQPFHFWLHTSKNRQQGLEGFFVHPCSWKHYLQWLRGRSNPRTRQWMIGLDNVVYMYNGLLFNLKKEWNFDKCLNVNEPQGHYTK